MPSRALAISPGVAQLLRDRRQALGLTLRAVAEMSGEHGELIPHSTLARIEMGRLDPGVRRLQQLLDLYQLPMAAAGEILALEGIAGPTPIERDPVKLRDRATTAWREGRIPDAIASFFAFRRRVPNDAAHREMRHDAILRFAMAAAALGRLHLSRHMLDEVLIEGPDPKLVPNILIQQSVNWSNLGSSIAAYAFLEEAKRRADVNEPHHLAWVEHQRGRIQVRDGEYRVAARSFATARRLYRQTKDRHQELLVQLSVAKLFYESGRPRDAVKTALEVERIASRHRFHRTRLGAQIERARNLLKLDQFEQARSLLRSVLAEAIDDNFLAFHAHFYLWKAETALGNTGRAAVEEREARYYLKFVDQNLPEAASLREGLERRPSYTTSRKDSRRTR